MKRLWMSLILLALGITSTVYAEDITLIHPIAYTGHDGNIYVTDLENTYAITDDASINGDATAIISYSDPHWSLNGQHLVFFRNQGEQSIPQAIMVAQSGQIPEAIITSDDGYAFDSATLALSPDGSQLAFWGWEKEEPSNSGLFVMSFDTGEINLMAHAIMSFVGGPFEGDPAIRMVQSLTGNPAYREQFALVWGENGILHTLVSRNQSTIPGNLALLTSDGDHQWVADATTDYLISRDGSHIVSRSFLKEGWVTINPQTGEQSSLNIPEDARPLGWLDGQLYYRILSDPIRVTGNLDMSVGIDVYDWIWGFEATSSTATIFLHIPDGEDILITQLQAHDLGTIHGPNINHMLVTLVQSNVPAVLAINEGASAADVEDLTARPISRILRIAYKENAIVVGSRVTIPGVEAIYNYNNFMIVTDN